MTLAPDVTVAPPAAERRPASPSARTRSLGYQPSLDGLRAFAVIAVMLYHGGVTWAHGGFLGVDIFFVLSGYLITSLLLVERSRWGSIDLRAFWMRRARRLLPALFLVLAVVGLAAPAFARPDRLGQLRWDGFATLAYVANWRFIATGQSYFDQFAAPSPFRHMWSLGIEEQWYWLFPLLLMFVVAAARRRRRRVVVVLGALALVSATEMAWLISHGADLSRVYYGTDTRVQELLVGSVLAVVVHRSSRRGSAAASTQRSSPWWGRGSIEALAGALGVLAVIALASEDTGWLYRGGMLVLSVFVVLLLDGLRRDPASPVSKGLSWRPLVLVGVVSYGLYLWHWPVFLYLTPDRTGLGGAPLLALRFAVTAGIAALSYRLLERPIRSGALQRRFSPPAGGRVIVAVSVVGVVAALMLGTSGAVKPAAIESTGTFETRIASPAIGQQSVLIVGDSPGRFLDWYLPRDILSGYALSESTTIGCGLLPQTVVVGDTVTAPQPQCDGYLAEWKRAADQARPDAVILSVGFWELFDKQVDGQVLRVGSPAWTTAFLDRLEQVRAATTQGKVPLLMLNVPCMGQQEFVVQGVHLEPVINDARRQQLVNHVLGEFAAAHPGDVSVLDDRSLLCPNGAYQPKVDGVQVRPDGVHVGGPGGRFVGAWLKPFLDEATARADRVRTIMVGDSVTWSLETGFDPRATPGVQPWATTKLGCALDPVTEVVGSLRSVPAPGCAAWRSAWPALAKAAKPDLALVLPGVAEIHDRVVAGTVAKLGTPEYQAALFSEFDRAIRDAGAERAALVTSPCRRLADNGTSPQIRVDNDANRLATLNDLVRRYVDSHPGVGLIDLNAYLCPNGYQNTLDGVTLHSDGMHFTPEGAAKVWQWLAPQVRLLASSGTSGP